MEDNISFATLGAKIKELHFLLTDGSRSICQAMRELIGQKAFMHAEIEKEVKQKSTTLTLDKGAQTVAEPTNGERREQVLLDKGCQTTALFGMEGENAKRKLIATNS